MDGQSLVKFLSKTEMKSFKLVQVWNIRNYSLFDKKIGVAIKSPKISSRGYELQLWLYPLGLDKQAPFFSLFIHIVNAKRTVIAKYKMALLDGNGKEMYMRQVADAAEFSPSENNNSGIVSFVTPDELAKSIVDDCLTIQCEADIADETYVTSIEIDGLNPLLNGQQHLETSLELDSDHDEKKQLQVFQRFKRMLGDTFFADVIFNVDNSIIKAHRRVLAASSPVFKALFDDNLEREVTIIVTDLTSSTMNQLLEYMYCGQLESKGKETVELLLGAHRYNLPGLKLCCEKALQEKLDVETVCQVLIVSDECDADRLKEGSIQFIGDNLEHLQQTANWKMVVNDHPHLAALVAKAFNEKIAALRAKAFGSKKRKGE